MSIISGVTDFSMFPSPARICITPYFLLYADIRVQGAIDQDPGRHGELSAAISTAG